MATVAWFHCFAGIAGDMALGSLIDAGAPEGDIVNMLRRLPVDGWELRCEPVLRGGIACTRAIVEVDGAGGRTSGSATVGRTQRDLASAVLAAAFPARVERRALGVFEALAGAEGALHGVAPAQVHFHEVGGHDALIDVVGTVIALELLGVDEVAVSAVALGTGTIDASHGTLPNPPPAVLRLLEGVPSYGRPLHLELTTPTGAALVRSLVSGDSAFGPMPAMTVRASGYGAGSAELDALPNCTQVVIGRAAEPARTGSGQPVTVLEVNLDDATGEQLAIAMADILDAGALDAWITPVLMKKGRPGHTVHVLCDPARADTLAGVVRRATGSFGVRATQGERWPERRLTGEVSVEGHTIRMKAGTTRAKAEPDDVARVAAATGLGAREVTSRAEEAWRRQEHDEATTAGTDRLPPRGARRAAPR